MSEEVQFIRQSLIFVAFVWGAKPVFISDP